MTGQNLTGYTYQPATTKPFTAINPVTGKQLEGDFYPANHAHVNHAVQLATQAFPVYKNIAKDKKAAFLRAIATEIEALGDVLIERASAESGLPLGRIKGELGRTCGQLRLFADVVAEGSWVEAVIDSPLPNREPMPRPGLCKMLVALGPVVVFGASNFPLAFSVAGGDTASALAAGCPVIVKAHPAHPGTGALVAEAIRKAAEQTQMPDGVFSLLFDDGFSVGEALVKHENIKAVTFTGSFKGGMAIYQLAQQRREPIPVFAEMGSINPVVLLPGILQNKAEDIAAQYAGSITLGAGQFCTNPGLLLGVASPELARFEMALAKAISAVPPSTMLTPGIYQNFKHLSAELLQQKGIEVIGTGAEPESDGDNQAGALVAKVKAVDFIANPALSQEVFGPYSLLVVADTVEQLKQLIDVLDGQLTVTIMGETDELSDHKELIEKAGNKAGRIILNGVPTGVEVCAAMQHGGPFPATTDSRFTSVGTSAIRRFVRPVSWQGWGQDFLPDELKDGNPLNIWRMVDQQWTKD
ncbi:aldehyde dehydrogenase (NADP(+)) [Mucilaginibacter segetis]|uniref:Aldehyde dehydrogenase (NADP(+)) n=1 Tax=Mucilaginibacter segetis TaxID=2793071 RepID=A0A934PV29_9SPHI|nr:aldehyde dehydrogenase (NADP(+)) [Mucilaginibacter segetis]MBK0379646.1 aldehyde dehydrogenase (NADP(+)) [Mucilaginibacter segetis]